MNKYGLSSIPNAPTGIVVTTEETKSHLNIAASDGSHDADIARFISKAVDWWQRETDTFLQEITDAVLTLDCFPNGDIHLPFAPVTSVTQIQYIEADNTTTTAFTDYTFSPHLFPPRIKAWDRWPQTSMRGDAVTITLTAGYDTNTIPDAIREGILLLVGHWFENREAVLTGSISKEVEYSIDAIAAKFRLGNAYLDTSG